MSEGLSRAVEIEQAAQCVARQPNAKALAGFVYEVVSTWAEGRSLFAGHRFMSGRAARYELTHENAATELGNVLTMLERGARGAAEISLISAFATLGWNDVFVAAEPDERKRHADTLVAQLDWIELATDYRLSAYAERLLGEPGQRALCEALGRAVLRDDAGADAVLRARNSARITLLANLQLSAAQFELRNLRRAARDPLTRALCAALVSEPEPELPVGPALPPVRVSGLSRTPSRSLPVALLRWLSGYALVSALQRLACYLVALRRELDVELRGEALRVRSRTSLMGRTLRSSEACYDVWRVTGACRRARFALLRSVVGVLSLSLGVLIGGYMVFDGARGGAPLLLLLGAAVVAAGSSVDLALNVLLPARRARVDVQVDLRGASSLRLGRVEQADADRLLDALSLRLAR